MFGTSEQEGVSVDVTGEGFSTTAVANGMHWFELRILPLPLRRSYIKRQRGNSSVDLNPIVYGSFLHCFVSFSGTDNRLIRSSKKVVRSSYCYPLLTAKEGVHALLLVGASHSVLRLVMWDERSSETHTPLYSLLERGIALKGAHVVM